MKILEKLRKDVNSKPERFYSLNKPLYLDEKDFKKYKKEVSAIGMKTKIDGNDIQLWFCGIPVYLGGTKPLTLEELNKQL